MRPTVLLDLIEHLSPGAALWRAIDPDLGWSPTDLLLAALVDEVRFLTYVTRKVNGDKRARPPQPVPRPGATQPSERTVERVGASEGFDTIAEFEAWYSRAQASRPEIDTRGRAMPPRDARGRFVSA